MSRFLLLLAAVAFAAPSSDAASARRARALMGTTCTVDVEAATEEAAAAAAVAALDEVARLETVLSTWSPVAEMFRANAAAQQGTATITGELAGVLSFALAQAKRTGGTFDPVVGALVDAWDLRGAGRVPSPRDLAAARAASGHRLALLDAGASSLRFASPAAWIDTGGFGKGLALDAASAAATRAGATSALFDFGGQLLAMGAPEGAEWGIAVADPRDRARPALQLALREASASTSAQSERFLQVGARRLGHVVDPRTGEPITFGGSATVIASTGAEADALSTALLVMGPVAGLRFAASESLCAGFLVPERNGTRLVLRATPSFLALLRASAPDVRVRGVSHLSRSARR